MVKLQKLRAGRLPGVVLEADFQPSSPESETRGNSDDILVVGRGQGGAGREVAHPPWSFVVSM
jgi:hypothetical protein